MTHLKIIILVFSLLIVQDNYAQILSKKDFSKTEWFSDNTDSIFYKNDTIRLIKFSNIQDSGKGYKIFYERGILADNQTVQFQFNRNGNMNFWVIYYHMGTISKLKERKWKIDKKLNEFIIFRNGEIEFRLKPIAIKEIEFKVNDNNYKTIELTMIKK